MYWQYAYVPPTASTFSATGSKQPRHDGDSRSGVSMLPNESLDQSPMSMIDKAKKMGFKITKQSSNSSSSHLKPGSRKQSSDRGVNGQQTQSDMNAPRMLPQNVPASRVILLKLIFKILLIIDFFWLILVRNRQKSSKRRRHERTSHQHTTLFESKRTRWCIQTIGLLQLQLFQFTPTHN